MKVYLDTSAFLKLLFDEPESAALANHLGSIDRLRLMSSVLLETEARRAAARVGFPQLGVTEVLRSVNLAAAPRSVFTSAGLLPGSNLRSLDALHLVTALHHSADVVLAYDRRLVAAAADHGLTTVSPA